MSMFMVTDAQDSAALYRLMAWLSPSYPVGAFSYSSGIEWAVEAGDIKDAESLRRWLAVVIGEGRYAMQDAAEGVVVEYDPLPAVTDPEAALQEGSPLVHPEVGTNETIPPIAG